MQGLALADFLTALSTYGFEPIFLSQYNCYSKEDYLVCHLPYPYCLIATHLSLMSMTFHTVSVVSTACLGIQKVLAINHPIWTKVHMTNEKAAVCCASCFVFPIIISFPCHFVFDVKNEKYACKFVQETSFLFEYFSLFHLVMHTVLVLFCCILMLLSTIFINYKLVTNKFRNPNTKQGRQERRSVIIVVVVFLISEHVERLPLRAVDNEKRKGNCMEFKIFLE